MKYFLVTGEDDALVRKVSQVLVDEKLSEFRLPSHGAVRKIVSDLFGISEIEFVNDKNFPAPIEMERRQLREIKIRIIEYVDPEDGDHGVLYNSNHITDTILGRQFHTPSELMSGLYEEVILPLRPDLGVMMTTSEAYLRSRSVSKSASNLTVYGFKNQEEIDRMLWLYPESQLLVVDEEQGFNTESTNEDILVALGLTDAPKKEPKKGKGK